MPPAVLATKLFVPPPRPGGVPRARLVQRLQRGLHRRLTLVAAPAGFGKTTLLAAWIAGGDRTAAWISLDAGDAELPRFAAHLVAALRTVAPGVGESVLAALDAPRPPPTAALLTPLVNDLAALPEPLLLVLDDLHAVDGRAVDEALAFLVEHLPPQLHLALASREDPPLPLARLRADGQLTEVRAADLRFSPEEAAAFLNDVMALELSAEQVAALERRTEGWIAGLQMAALSLQGRGDAEAFIDGFTGSHRFVLDYLADEVLQRQSEAVRAFLLRTSLPERLCGPLCDALAGGGATPGRATLEALERADLPLVPLDEERVWYRYHHLFADVLRATLQRERPGEVPELHRRASAWHERNGFAADAVRHAFASGDVARAADLVEATWREMDRSYRSGAWLAWARELPDETVRARPLLGAGVAWALLDAGDMEAAEPRLADVERWLAAHGGAAPDASAGRVALDAAELRRLPAVVASGRAYHARGVGDAAASAEHARRALELLPGDDPFERGLARLLLGCALWAGGELAGARAAVADAADDMWAAGNAPFAISFGSYLADIVVAQGRLAEAEGILRRSLDRARDAEGGPSGEIAVLHLALAEIHHERGEDDAADRHLAASAARGEQPAFPPWHRHWSPARARRLAARGDPEGALAELGAGARLAYRHAVPDARPLAAMRARLLVARGRLAEARTWAAACGLAADDAPAYLREYEHLTLARLLVAEARRDDDAGAAEAAAALLARLLAAAEAGGREGAAIEILMLRALVRDAAGAPDAALEPLARALARAEPEGWTRLFLDEGAPMLRLLAAAAAHGVPGVGRLLAARDPDGPAPERPARRPSPATPLVEPLSERELAALRLIAQGLSNREVGARLHRALDTVKGYTRRIYGKLGVRNRTEAVARARALGLLDE